MTHHPIAVLGASGGVGASTLAAALARRLADRGEDPVLVDGDLTGGGIDVTVGAEHLTGLRWPDLSELRGAVDGPSLLRALPLDRGVRLLSSRRAPDREGLPDQSARIAVLDALAPLAPVVLDLRRGDPALGALLARCDRLLLVCGVHVRALADADALVGALLDDPAAEGRDPRAGPTVQLVTRGPGGRSDLAETIEEHLGVAHLVHIADDHRVARAGERGDWPGQRHTALGGAVDTILDRTGGGLGLVS